MSDLIAVTDLVVWADSSGASQGWAELAGERFRCALGRGGIRTEKREGDGGTPTGRFPLRRLYYRGEAPATSLPILPITPQDGWCDAPDDIAYNRAVRLPYAASHEKMWREDHLYDRVLVIGHNDDPVVPGLGSAVFIHLAREGYLPTEGCVAFAREDLERILSLLSPGDHVVIRAA